MPSSGIYKGLSFINTTVKFSEQCYIWAARITALLLNFSFIFSIFRCSLYLFPQNSPLPTYVFLPLFPFSLTLFRDYSPPPQRFPRNPDFASLLHHLTHRSTSQVPSSYSSSLQGSSPSLRPSAGSHNRTP